MCNNFGAIYINTNLLKLAENRLKWQSVLVKKGNAFEANVYQA